MTNEIKSDLITIHNETGIHARPASYLFQIANKYKAVIKLKKGEKIVNAKSIIAILGLGVKHKEQIQIIATGEDAKEAIDKLVDAINSGMGEQVHNVQTSHSLNVEDSHISASASAIVKDFSSEVVLKGVIGSPGLIIGNSYLCLDEEINVVEEDANSENQLILFETSLKALQDNIMEDIVVANQNKHKAKVEIFEAHLKILEDNSLIEDAKIIINQDKTAGFAWKSVIAKSIDILNSTGNSLLMERTADLKDLQQRLLKIILGIKDNPSTSFPNNSIIIAKDLVPSDIVKFDKNVVGVVLAFGSSTSHVSLMLRNMGVPTLVVVGESVLYIANSTNIVLNANEGLILVNPSKEKLLEISKTQQELNKIKELNIANAKQDAITLDGKKIKVKGNVSNPIEAKKAYELGAQGLGLLRTEFLFFNSKEPLNLEEQSKIYQEALDSMQGGSITLRTLDVGGDKPLNYIKIGKEDNPILGLRGVRNYSLNMEIFTTQIKAVLSLKPLLLVNIMIPMVSEISEMIQMREIIEKEKNKLGITEKISIGTMIEVPSAAILADKFAKYVDFFSIGTNDLTQYTLAMDRGNPNLTARLKNLNPSLLRLIQMTVQGGKLSNIPTAVCGAMASEINAIPILIGLGVDELSTSMRSIPDVKALIRSLNYEKCQKVANLALQMESAEQVLDLVKKEFNL